MDKAKDAVIRVKQVGVESQERSDGDGMESREITSDRKILIPLPSPHVSKARHRSTVSSCSDPKNTSRSAKKEPKFVPYEPYKAAISLIIPNEKLKQDLKQCKSFKDGLYLCAPKLVDKPEKVILSDAIHLNQCRCKFAESNKILEEEIKCLKQEKLTLENQLKMQTQVNHDLKKLLVASVGEDMQTKVQFLTEDKTKLAHDIVHYSQKMMEDSEHLEKLSIQCDVWRSKFLASSVMVDELAGWKAILGHQLNEALEIIKVLLDEQEKISIHSRDSLHYLKSMCEKCDKDTSQVTKTFENALDVAAENEAAARFIHEKLFGSVPDSINSCLKLPNNCKTPGEQLAYQILSSSLPHHYLSSESHLTADALMCACSHFYRGMLPRFHPSTQYDHLTFNCCYQCRGDIKLM